MNLCIWFRSDIEDKDNNICIMHIDNNIHIIHKNPTTHPGKQYLYEERLQINPTTRPGKIYLYEERLQIDDHTQHAEKNPATRSAKIDNQTHHGQKPFSISDILFFNKPFVPLWLINPTYFYVEKYLQILGHLLYDRYYSELKAPKHYYDTSI
ncbi:unnamed protein product [Schistosoma turkestanicum]|nr:unnamed protein product [Schistosoma turkestanicum]